MINRCICIVYYVLTWPSQLDELTGNERNEARYGPREKKEHKLLSLQMSLFVPILSLFFLLLFCVSFCQMEHEGKPCNKMYVIHVTFLPKSFYLKSVILSHPVLVNAYECGVKLY
jgi:hypothetical protein